MDKVKDKLYVTMNDINLGDHVHEIERNKITVKERYLEQYHRLPFQNIPKVMIIYLYFELAIKLDYFPVKRCLAPHYSLQTIVYQKPLDYNKHFKITLGAFVQAKNYNNPTNSIKSLDKRKG